MTERFAVKTTFLSACKVWDLFVFFVKLWKLIIVHADNRFFSDFCQGFDLGFGSFFIQTHELQQQRKIDAGKQVGVGTAEIRNGQLIDAAA